jgi:hypothetical protein
VAGLFAAVAFLPACSGGGGDGDALPAPSPTQASTSSSSSTLATATTVAVTTTVTARPTTTSPAASPEGHATALYDAWTRGDQVAAARVAQPEAVTDLFARRWQASDGWSFSECSGAAGSVICTWRRPGGQQLLMRVQNRSGGLPVTVSEVRFQP